jgi:hypothetical protein
MSSSLFLSSLRRKKWGAGQRPAVLIFNRQDIRDVDTFRLQKIKRKRIRPWELSAPKPLTIGFEGYPQGLIIDDCLHLRGGGLLAYLVKNFIYIF